MRVEGSVTLSVDEYIVLLKDQALVDLLIGMIRADVPVSCLKRALTEDEEDLQSQLEKERAMVDELQMRLLQVEAQAQEEIDLESEEPGEPEEAEDPEPASKRKYDHGKIMALYNAGWTYDAIAQEISPMEDREKMIKKLHNIVYREKKNAEEDVR